MLDQRRDWFNGIEARWSGRWYEPPIPPMQLARTRWMSPHHSSAIKLKVNHLLRLFVPSRWLSAKEFEKYALNFLSMGNAALQRTDNLAGRAMTLTNVPTVYLRVGRDGLYWWVANLAAPQTFAVGTIFHLIEPDLLQEVYGVPDWLAALQAGLLAEAATVFRRRYYLNGSHMGYILYIAEETFSDTDADALETALEQSKGPGNFKNLLLHIPKGGEKGVQVLPIGDKGAQDEFVGIKETSRDDVLVAHRVPPVLLGIVPKNAGGLGDPAKAADTFHYAEIEPLQRKMMEVNDWLGYQAVTFTPYERQAGQAVGVPAA